MNRFKLISCVVDDYDPVNTALIQAAEIARRHQAKLRVLTVIKKPDGALINLIKEKDALEKTWQALKSTKQKHLDSLLATHCQGIKTESALLSGISFIEIIRDVLQFQPDMLVKCSQNVSWLKRLFGGDDMHLLRKCPCPILMLKPGHIEPCLNILATVDVMDESFKEDSEYRVQDQLNTLVLEYASVFALSESSELRIGSVWDAFGENFLRYGTFAHASEEKIHNYVQETQAEYSAKLNALCKQLKNLIGEEALDYIQPIAHLVKGLPEKEIPLMVTKYDVDLIVMGTVARTGIPGLFIGNTAEAILEQVQCSVLAIKPRGFETPVTLND